MLRRASQLSKRIAAWPESTCEPTTTAGPAAFLGGLGFATLQLRLTKFGGFCRIGARFQVALFQKISPALVPVRRALLAFEVLQDRLCVLSPLYNLDHARRLISADIMTDDNVRSLEFVVCQMLSL